MVRFWTWTVIALLAMKLGTRLVTLGTCCYAVAGHAQRRMMADPDVREVR